MKGDLVLISDIVVDRLVKWDVLKRYREENASDRLEIELAWD